MQESHENIDLLVQVAIRSILDPSKIIFCEEIGKAGFLISRKCHGRMFH